MMRQQKTAGLVLGPNGKLQRIEFKGPSSYPLWKGCWAVLRTGLLMLEQCSQSSVDNYQRHIRRYSDLYGDRAWALIYQTDVRWRRDRVDRLRGSQAPSRG